MKAIFKRSKNVVNPKVAELFVRIGIATWIKEPKVDDKVEVIEDEKKEVFTRPLKVIEKPFIPKDVKPKGKPKGRPAKVKK
jgi:hypothetical protein